MDGQYNEAERIYMQLHHRDRRDEEVLYLLGVLCCDLGIFDAACRFLDEALAINPQFPEAFQQLAVALNHQAKIDMEAGKFDEAEANLTRALNLIPNDAKAILALGRLALLRNDAVLAESLLARALQQAGDDVDGLNWHGLACLEQKKYALAEQSLQRALASQPDLSQARNNLGLALYNQGRLEEARACFAETLARDGAYANARINLANTLRILGQPEEARRQLAHLLADHPDSVEALNNLGTVLQDLGLAQQARDCLQRAAGIAPDSPPIRWNLALSQLLLEDYAEGWANFEARWEGCASLRDAYDKPASRAWYGESLHGKRLLLWAEQGFGDTLQFIRFADDAARQGAIVTVEAQPELLTLIAHAPGISAVVARGQSLPPYDLHCPLMSLPYRLGSAFFAPTGRTPYLTAEPQRVAYWKDVLQSYPGLKVGLTWAGRSRLQHAELAAIDARRSIRLQQLAPLLQNQSCSFFSVQKDAPTEEKNEASSSLHDFSSEWHDFSDTAAFIANLDLLITVDTAVAHLAGALGKPVWLLNRRDTCWRWQQEGANSSWYPTLRQFRQTETGNWDTVVVAVNRELHQLATYTS